MIWFCKCSLVTIHAELHYLLDKRLYNNLFQMILSRSAIQTFRVELLDILPEANNAYQIVNIIRKFQIWLFIFDPVSGPRLV